VAGFGEEFVAHVAAGFGPFVVLFGQDSADQADECGAVGEDPDDVRATPDLLMQCVRGPRRTYHPVP
jgi:hypothetical protein